MAKKLEIKLINSTIGRPEKQKITAKTLGLNKVNATVIQPDNEAVRGMINKISHLVEVKEI